MNEFISKHSVRIYGVIAAVTPVLISRFPHVPWEAVAATAAALLGVGEVAQRHEDAKTVDALHESSPWDLAAAAQAAVTAFEENLRKDVEDAPAVEVEPAPAVEPEAAATEAVPAVRTPVPASQVETPAQS